MRIGAGAGFAGDRIEPAVDLVRHGELDYLVLECLAERTLALAHQRQEEGTGPGYDQLWEERLRALLPETLARGVTIVTNAGAAAPLEAGQRAVAIAEELGLDLKVAVVTGDDVADFFRAGGPIDFETGPVVSANAYLGADAILPAIESGAQLVVTGRTADASLFVAAALAHLGSSIQDRSMVAAATLLGHLLECGGQVTGGYFADGGRKHVEEVGRLGYPIGILDLSGEVRVEKLPGAGGRIDRAVVTEQLLYEVLDPHRYVTPDGVIDMTAVEVVEEAAHHVRLRTLAPAGDPPPDLKVTVAYHAGFVAEASVSYSGYGALDRARLAEQVVRERLRDLELVTEFIDGELHDARGAVVTLAQLRVVYRSMTRADVERVCREVASLYTNGPAGGGGIRSSSRTSIGVSSAYLPRGATRPALVELESEAQTA